MQLELGLELEATPEEICMMCHFSSECDGCCKRCENFCNSEQTCMQGKKGQFQRLQSWMSIINSDKYFDYLKKYIPR